MARNNDYKIESTEDQEDFLSKIATSIKAAAEDQRLLHGKRVEALFAHVAGALGNCLLVKPEDNGGMVAVGVDVRVPDYSLVLRDGSRLMVEVKNCHLDNFKTDYEFTRDYVEALERYANLHGASLKFAIYFSRLNKWVLLSKMAFIERKRKFTINMLDAIAKNEMSTLGDRSIGTIPALSIELIASDEQDSYISEDGEARFVIGRVRNYCAGNEVINERDKQIVFQLIRFGRWVEAEPQVIMDGARLLSVRFDYSPYLDDWDKEAGFAIVGELSSIVSSAYNEHTVYARRVIALDTKVDPDFFSIDITDGYSGENLPLWQLKLQPNFSFSSKGSKAATHQ